MTDPNALNKILEKARQDLLDLSLRNTLLSAFGKNGKPKGLQIVGERSDDVFRVLVQENKAISFRPSRDDSESPNSDEKGSTTKTEQAANEPVHDQPNNGLNTRLRTSLAREPLQDELLRLYYDAETAEEEQGVSILYLALGFLEWYPADNPSAFTPRSSGVGKIAVPNVREADEPSKITQLAVDPVPAIKPDSTSKSAEKIEARFAPLLLIPVTLERTGVAERFRLHLREAEISTNLSLQSKIQKEFGVEIPDVPDVEDLTPASYFAKVESVLSAFPRWRVLRDDILLGLFSFETFLMYRDLDPANWPADKPLTGNPVLSRLLTGTFAADPPLCGEDDKIDPVIPPEHLAHVVDADSSQALVIEEVRRGRNLVVQGPPGTGKSQTITNMIAAAIKAGKNVLFVAEKMAALEVVSSRLSKLGLIDMCLELHGRKKAKTAVLGELKRTLDLGRPCVSDGSDNLERLVATRDRLNRHAEAMNRPLVPAGITPFQVFGELLKCYADDPKPVNLQLVGATGWPKNEFDSKSRQLVDFQKHLEGIGIPAHHPWFGVRLNDLPLPTDITDIISQATKLSRDLAKVEEAVRACAAAVKERVPEPINLEGVRRVYDLCRHLDAAPPMDRAAIEQPVWETRSDQLAELVHAAREATELRSRIEPMLSELAWDTDFSSIRRAFGAYGRLIWRWLHRDYRNAVAALRGMLKVPLPRSANDRLRLVDEIIKIQSWDQRQIEGEENLGAEAFGSMWKGKRTDWAALESVVHWVSDGKAAGLPEIFRTIYAQMLDPSLLSDPLRELERILEPLETGLTNLFGGLRLDLTAVFGTAKLVQVPLSVLRARLAIWKAAPEELNKWVAYYLRADGLKKDGLAELVAGVVDGNVPVDAVVVQFRQAYYETLIRHIFATDSEIKDFDGRTYVSIVEEFKRLDEDRIRMARAEVMLAHYEGIPRDAMLGEMGIVRFEIAKKQRQKPIRKLLKEAGRAVQAIKPVFMMSPLSIAQFLEPGTVEFDLMVLDEASQVTPAVAFGAIARCKQIVVVGDDKQMPPSQFFAGVQSGDETPEADEVQDTSNIKSILELCDARMSQLSKRKLRWHYRSRHHSLIAVSNHRFYNNELFVVPNPIEKCEGLGLKFRYIENGQYDRGKSRTNRVEAQEVARAVLEHVRDHRDKTLGVATFSRSQFEAIDDELHLLADKDLNLKAFINDKNAFFVKNLERVQGDERDVIFISVGYGRINAHSAAFGPITASGGWRRFNVLITRAREQCVVFSSIKAEDIVLDKVKDKRGPGAFKDFLRYAETGILDTQDVTGRGFDSEFEAQVHRALCNQGFEVHPQVGTAGFRIDLAVVDPNHPGQYLLGIECDGATYHSSRWARDRDRLREQVLRDHGWKIHRIWSTDWFHYPQEQLRKMLTAIDLASRSYSEPTVTLIAEKPSSPTPPIIRDEPPSNEVGVEIAAIPYEESNFPVPSQTDIHELRSVELAKIVERITAIEGPIHREEIARRITGLWGLKRTGNRISDAVNSAIDVSLRAGRIKNVQSFMSPADQDFVPIRNRSAVRSAGLKDTETLPPPEIRAAIIWVIGRNLGIAPTDVPAAVARLLGFATTSARLREVIGQQISQLNMEGQIVDNQGRLMIGNG